MSKHGYGCYGSALKQIRQEIKDIGQELGVSSKCAEQIRGMWKLYKKHEIKMVNLDRDNPDFNWDSFDYNKDTFDYDYAEIVQMGIINSKSESMKKIQATIDQMNNKNI